MMDVLRAIQMAQSQLNGNWFLLYNSSKIQAYFQFPQTSLKCWTWSTAILSNLSSELTVSNGILNHLKNTGIVLGIHQDPFIEISIESDMITVIALPTATRHSVSVQYWRRKNLAGAIWICKWDVCFSTCLVVAHDGIGERLVSLVHRSGYIFPTRSLRIHQTHSFFHKWNRQ